VIGLGGISGFRVRYRPFGLGLVGIGVLACIWWEGGLSWLNECAYLSKFMRNVLFIYRIFYII
jgi:hypothetical protein